MGLTCEVLEAEDDNGGCADVLERPEELGDGERLDPGDCARVALHVVAHEEGDPVGEQRHHQHRERPVTYPHSNPSASAAAVDPGTTGSVEFISPAH